MNAKKIPAIERIILTTLLATLVHTGIAASTLEESFRNPPATAKPWVYWFWLNGNLTKEGMTADLEAMHRAGIGGVLIMEVDQGAPVGPVDFMSDRWRELFKHMVGEAARLGIEVNMNNDAGWNGSGGPWVPLDKAMQVVVATETQVQGGRNVTAPLPRPQATGGFYRDIAVLAYPTPKDAGNPKFRIQNLPVKAMSWKWMQGSLATQPTADVPATAIVAKDGIVDLTGKMDDQGTLAWDAPAGDWTVVRLGHTFTGARSHPAPATGAGPECDKLNKDGIEANYRGMIGKLAKDVGPLAGKVFAATHVDSWEVGAQNWTPKMRDEFRRLRGYDPLPYLPVLTSQIVDSPDVSERFLRDLRQTVSDLLAENYIGHLRTLAHADGLRLSMEAYTAPANDQDVANHIDEPICEFWWPDGGNLWWSVKAMASVAHVNGLPVVGAEAFTANNHERWLAHPAVLKALGDRAFCDGVNRFIVHRYAMQPWTDHRWPGMTMGPWGVHYERSNTWWEDSKAWHQYLRRCQYLLRQGRFVADVLVLQSEEPMQRFTGVSLQGYDYDGISPQAFLKDVSVKDGRLILPSGMSYRVLVLPPGDSMSAPMLEKIATLVEAGATVVGNPPVKAPGLTGYPQADEQVKTLAAKVWRGSRVTADKTAGELLASMSVPPDFTSDRPLRYIHRAVGDRDVYFVASSSPLASDALCTFRVHGKSPEAWFADSGRIEPIAIYEERDGCTRIPLHFDPAGSIFVVFQPRAPKPAERIVSIRHDGRELLDLTSTGAPAQNLDVTNTFAMVAWVNPQVEIKLPGETNAGLKAFSLDRNDVLFPPPGHEVWGGGDAGVGFTVGRNGVCVYEHGAFYFPAVLVHAGPIHGWTHVAIVYHDGVPSLYLNGTFARTGLKGPLIAHPGVGVGHGREIKPFRGQVAGLRLFTAALTEEQVARLARETPPAPDAEGGPAFDLITMQTARNGSFVIKTANGASRQVIVSGLPAPQAIVGPWNVTFAPGLGAPEQIKLDRLVSWSEHPDDRVKYYSGAAVYRTTFHFSPALLSGPSMKPAVSIDLGSVAVMAEVKVNGEPAGTLWKPPYRANITDLLQPGKNELEIRVVSLPINRMLGDELLPEDSERTDKGTLKHWPQWLLDGKPSPTGRFTFTSWRLWKKDEPLQPSGLLGPVTLRFHADLRIR